MQTEELNPLHLTSKKSRHQDKRLFFLFNMARHHLFGYVDAECDARLGISVTQAGALLYIAKKEGCYQKDLGDALGLKKSTVTGLVSRMEKNGLVKRKACKQDGRASTLFLSQLGNEIIPQIILFIKSINDEFLSDFSDEEMDVIFKFLNRIIKKYS